MPENQNFVPPPPKDSTPKDKAEYKKEMDAYKENYKKYTEAKKICRG